MAITESDRGQFHRKVKLAIGLWIIAPIFLLPGVIWIILRSGVPIGESSPGDGIPFAFSVFSFGFLLILAIICTISCLIDFARSREKAS
jgi:hypothetical protein